MKFAAIAVLALLACGCAAATEHRYAGSPGSVYDKAQEPPRDFPPSDYDALANDTARRAAQSAKP
jgi:hypothetical protein